MNKKCSKCGVEQVPENFRKGNICNVCERAYQKEYRAKHKNYHKNWRAKNPERVRAYNEKWKETHPEYNKNMLRGDNNWRVYVIETAWKNQQYYYIGSTIKKLNYRLSAHLTAKTTTHFGKWIQNKKNDTRLTRLEIREVGVFDNKEDSDSWEKQIIRFFVRHHGDKCLNKQGRKSVKVCKEEAENPCAPPLDGV